MDLSGAVEFGTNARDATVHHVGRRHHVGSGLRVTKRLLGQRFERLVVEHVAARIVGRDQAILAVAGIGVKRHVGDDAELGERLLQRRHGARHQPVRIPGFLGARRLERRIDHRKQGQRRNAERLRAFGGLQQTIDALPLDAGHRSDCFDAITAVQHEDRID